MLANLGVITRMLVATVFLGAGVHKLRQREPPPLMDMVPFLGRNSSRSLQSTLFRTLSLLEIALGLLLFTHWLTLVALVASLAFLAFFTGLLLMARKKGYEGDCGCFGDVGSGPISMGRIASNVMLIAFALFAVAQYSIEGASRALWQLDPWDIFLVCFTVGILLAVGHLLRYVEYIWTDV